jgi:hypothetical protein
MNEKEQKQQHVMAWVSAVCEDARQDVVQANRLARQSPALGHYFLNVVKVKCVEADAWPKNYPGHYEEVEGLFDAYAEDQQIKEQAAQVPTLAEKLEGIETMLKALIETQTTKQQRQIAAVMTADTPAQDDGDAQEGLEEAPVEPDAEETTNEDDTEETEAE